MDERHCRGYNAELDELRKLSRATDYLDAMEQRERERTGIFTLKAAITKFTGSIEISREQCMAPLNHRNKPKTLNVI